MNVKYGSTEEKLSRRRWEMLFFLRCSFHEGERREERGKLEIKT